jgi:crotonobetainyl-CoA:carnitine CoA-transferase CaiB-like acyl-CoA transferase
MTAQSGTAQAMSQKPAEINRGPGTALADLRVLELGSMLAGPFVGSMLADFGAEVIKVEKPGVPDPLREWPPHKDGSPLWWKTMSRGKRVIEVDVSRPEGRHAALRLIERSDIVIENFRPGTMERWGLDPAVLDTKLPHVVWVRVSGYGQTGPYRKQGGYATIAEGFSGLASFTGFPETGPIVSAFPLGDYLAGLFGAYGAIVAVHERRRSGRGQVVDVSLFEPFVRIIESVVVRYDQTGQKKPRLGNQMEEDVPRNVYSTADDSYVSISCGSQRIFENLCDAIDRADLKSDPRFATMADRVANRGAIDAIVKGWIAAQPVEVALSRLSAHQVIAGRINDIADVLADPHVLARRTIASVDDPELGPMRMPAPVPNLSATPGTIRWTGREAGHDTKAVLRDIAGLAEDAIASLRRSGVI